MADSFRASPVDGQDPISFLDSPVPVRQASRNHLVHLKHHFSHTGVEMQRLTGFGREVKERVQL